MSEIARLRQVYEAARRVLRFNGVNNEKVIKAIQELDDACEEVKLFYAGNDIDIEKEARDLIRHADELGLTLRIDLKPLAMGNHEHVVETWDKRKK